MFLIFLFSQPFLREMENKFFFPSTFKKLIKFAFLKTLNIPFLIYLNLMLSYCPPEAFSSSVLMYPCTL